MSHRLISVNQTVVIMVGRACLLHRRRQAMSVNVLLITSARHVNCINVM